MEEAAAIGEKDSNDGHEYNDNALEVRPSSLLLRAYDACEIHRAI